MSPQGLRAGRQTARRQPKFLIRLLVLDETCGRRLGKDEASLVRRTAQVSHSRALIVLLANLGVLEMSFVKAIVAAAALAVAALAANRLRQGRRPSGQGRQEGARPAVLPRDRRSGHLLLHSPGGTEPGMWSRQPERHGQRQHGEAGLLVHPLRPLGLRHQLLHHLDVQVGPQRSGQPVLQRGRRGQSVRRHRPRDLRGRDRDSTACSARPSAGTRSSTPRSSPWGRCTTSRSKSAWTPIPKTAILAAAKRDFVAGLQFAFDLPYKGYFNVAPLMYWEFSTTTRFAQCDSGFTGPTPGRNLSGRRQHRRSIRPGRWKPTTTWISASCRRTCSFSRSAAARRGMGRRERIPIRCRSIRPTACSTLRSSSTRSRSV